jgi:hypothetical protein
MFKIYINIIILAAMFCCSVGSSSFYIGPYEVSFNSTEHPVEFLSLMPSHEWFLDKNDKWDTTSIYEGISTRNKSLMHITITEGALTNALINNLTSLAPNKGFIKLQQLERVIDGQDATVAKYDNISGGWPTQIAVIELRVYTGDSYFSDTRAVIQILGINYTDYEFDRVLDTFKIQRLVPR